MLLKSLGKTNCLTHIPNDINLELNNGTLTLKAGSKVYVPNGFESDGVTSIFDEVVIESDIKVYKSDTSTNTRLIYYRKESNSIGTFAYSSSGTTTPTDSGNIVFYNTTDNTIRLYVAGVLQTEAYSLPLAIVSAGNGVMINSIDQIFNGFGYIGSTVFALPGVKGLIPNGWDEVGRYNNIEVELDRVVINSGAWTGSKTRQLFLTAEKRILGGIYYFKQSTPPSITSANYERWYNIEENLMYYHSQEGTEWLVANPKLASIGQVISTSGEVTSLTINSVQTKHDYKNYILSRKKISDWTQPILTANGTMGKSSFACNQSDYYPASSAEVDQKAWIMFSGTEYDSINEWQINDVSTSSTYWAKFYNPNPLKITELLVTNGNNSYAPATFVLQGSNDDSTYTNLGTTNVGDFTSGEKGATWNATIDTTGWYKYYKIVVTPRVTTSIQVARLKITAEEMRVNRYLFARSKRKYYKYEGGTEPNATVVGSPTISNGIVSGFSTSNYLTYNKSVGTITSFEQVIKLKTGSNITTHQIIAAGQTCTGFGSIAIANSKILIYISSNGTSNDISSGTASSNTLTASTDYWLKYYWNGSIYKIDISTDDSNYTNYLTINSSLAPNFTGYVGMGTDTGASNKNPFLGSIDLTQSYIKINNKMWWNGTKAIESTVDDYDYYEYESLKFY